MEEVRDRVFADGEKVDTDGKNFIGCAFKNANLSYAGGVHPTFEACTFGDAGWRFDGPALRTVQFLQTIRNSSGGETFIDDLFQPGKLIGE